MIVRSSAFAALVAALLMAGCGGSGERAAVQAALEEWALSDEPADCTRLSTARLLRQSSKLPGQSGIQACEAAAAKAGAKHIPTAVTVTEVEVEGDQATAAIAVEGSSFDGQTIEVEAVRTTSGWKADWIAGFRDLDRERLAFELGREAMEEAEDPEEARTLSCVADRIGRLDEAGLEAIVLDPSIEPVLDLYEACETVSQAI